MLESLLPISDIVLLDVLVLGLLSTVGLIFALLLLLGKLQWEKEQFSAFRQASPQALVVWSLLTLFPVYFLGVITNQVADMWIDQPSYYYHLGLKSLWNGYGDDRTDDSIKCVMYGRVFDCGKDFCNECVMDSQGSGCEKDSCKEKNILDKANERFHEITNNILKNDTYRRYVAYSQKQVNVERLWVFVSLSVFVVCLLRLVFLLGWADWYWYRPRSKSSESPRVWTHNGGSLGQPGVLGCAPARRAERWRRISGCPTNNLAGSSRCCRTRCEACREWTTGG